MLLLQLLILALLLLTGTVGLIYALTLNGIFWTFVKEGTIMNVVKGEDFTRSIMAYANHFLSTPNTPWEVPDKPDWERIHKNDKAEYKEKHARYLDSRPFLERTFGMHWIGLWPIYKIDRYDFEWTEVHQADDGSYIQVHRGPEQTDFLYAKKFQYYIRLNAVETRVEKREIMLGGEKKELEEAVGPSVDFIFLITIEINNGYKARFATDDWLQQVTAAAYEIARNYGGSHTYGELVRDPQTHSDFFSTQISKLTEKRREGDKPGFAEVFGVTIDDANLISVELSEGQGELREATTRKYVEEQKADARRIEASGEADAIREVAEARNFDIKQRYGAAADFKDGMGVLEMEAVRDSSLTTYVQGGAMPAIAISPSEPKKEKEKGGEE